VEFIIGGVELITWGAELNIAIVELSGWGELLIIWGADPIIGGVVLIT
jgi:hypothetical protein